MTARGAVLVLCGCQMATAIVVMLMPRGHLWALKRLNLLSLALVGLQMVGVLWLMVHGG